ncbi:MAG TPA: FecR family protein [Thermodesulfobacteriota bacterium]
MFRVLPRSSPAGVVVAVLALVVGLHAAAAEAQVREPAAILTVAVGTVEVREPGASDWEAVSAGHEIAAGAMVRTGAGSKAEVTHAVGVIRLFQHTVLRLPAERIGETTVVRRPELLVGQSLFDVIPSRIGAFVSRVSTHARSLFEVVTPHVVSGVKGTRFAVIEIGGRTVVAVYEGKVEASDLDATPRDTVFLTYGQLAEYREGRLLRVQSFDFRDDWTGWAKPATKRPSFVDPSVGNSPPATIGESRPTDGGPRDETTAGLSDTGGGVSDTVGNVVGGVTGTVGGVVGGLTDTVGGVVGGLTDTVGGVVGGVTDTVGGVVGGVTDTVGGVVGGVTDTVGGVVGGVTDTVGDTTGSVIDTGGTLVGGVTDTVGGVVGGVLGTVGGLLGR